MAFTQKLLTAVFSSGSGGGSETVSGLRMTCHTLAAADKAMGALDLMIYGMTLSHMNQVSTLGWVVQKPGDHKISVYAGESTVPQGGTGFPAAQGMALVYTGNIWQAVSDFQGGPNLPLHVVAQAGSKEAALSVDPTSLNQKNADVADLMSKLAGQMGLQFENSGVDVKIAYPYLSGSARAQAMTLAEHANINWTIDRDKLAIWPSDGHRQGATPLISPQTGMVGYPSWSSVGVKVKTLFNNDLQLGGQIQIQSSITPANGTWTIHRIEHSLQCLTPNGEWFTTIEAWDPNKTGGVPPAA